MKKIILILSSLILGNMLSHGQEYSTVPRASKWVGEGLVAFSYDGRFTGEEDFAVDLSRAKGGFSKVSTLKGVSYPSRYEAFPVEPKDAVNLTYSPDSTMLAFTRGNDLWVVEISSGRETRLTFDGTDTILNGYASWVYYEEILGRPSRYRAFWWSPDSRTIAFYRFDNSEVPMFPIFSPVGQDGSLNRTRYPKCGEKNPEVRIGFVDIAAALSNPSVQPPVVWADFNEKDDQYFGTPFWGDDSRGFFVSREPRTQNQLDLYSVSPSTGEKTFIYHEQYKTWLDWIDGMLFGKDGLYMARSFETGWQQIYYLSYDGKTFRRLTDGPNWRVNLVRVDESKGEVFFTANRESTVRAGLYKVDRKGTITALTDPQYTASAVSFSPDGKYFVATLSNFTTPSRTYIFFTAGADKVAKGLDTRGRYSYKVADMAGPDFNADEVSSLPQIITLTTTDGLTIPAWIAYPRNFDPAKKYPVHMDIYGGPDTPRVIERWMGPSSAYRWFTDNDIIEITCDCRASGHNGREGLDQIYRHLDELEVGDFVQWARYLKSLPYVDGDKIGVEGFSFGGTMTSLLVMDHSDDFHYGIAGGGVYDWALYDTHYTERFMDTPANNPGGYARTRVVGHVGNYPVVYSTENAGRTEPVMLKLTHGTGDDNVHFQNTLQLVDELISQGKKFELMIYPDGMHGYRGRQGQHSTSADREFWMKYLKGK